MRSGIVVGAVIAVGLMGGLTAGCTVRGRAGVVAEEPVSTTYVTSAPVEDYSVYPHTVYEGREVYYVHDRWGYPHNGQFVYYRSEPPPLIRYRTQVRQAPPARHYDHDGRYEEHREYVQPAPNSPPASAPPAVRTR